MTFWYEKIGLNAFEKDYLNRNYNDENLNIWYIANEEKILATMMLKKMDNEIGKIENVCCDAEYRGKGLSAKLLDKLISFSKKMGLKKLQLGTYEHLERAIKFYEKYGFVEQKELRNPEIQARYYQLILE